MVWAAFTLDVFGFLGCSKFAYSGVNNFGPQFDLDTDCVKFYPSLACLQHIVVTRKSSRLFLFFSQWSVSRYCPGSGTRVRHASYAAVFPNHVASPRPLVLFQSGGLLTWSAVICLLLDATRHHSLKGHSFRIGGASTAAAAGLPDWLIKILGR